MQDRLEHTEKVKALIDEGRTKEAAELHNARVKDQFDKAQQGQTINLSDLIAAREQLDLARARENAGPPKYDTERRNP